MKKPIREFPKIKIFISAPYSSNPCVNTNKAMSVMNNLLNLGYAPFNPLLTHFQHTYHPRPKEDWYDLDNQFLRVCDVVLRLKGESPGANKEVELAKELNIPVVYNLESLRKLKINNEKQFFKKGGEKNEDSTDTARYTPPKTQ